MSDAQDKVGSGKGSEAVWQPEKFTSVIRISQGDGKTGEKC